MRGTDLLKKIVLKTREEMQNLAKTLAGRNIVLNGTQFDCGSALKTLLCATMMQLPHFSFHIWNYIWHKPIHILVKEERHSQLV